MGLNDKEDDNFDIPLDLMLMNDLPDPSLIALEKRLQDKVRVLTCEDSRRVDVAWKNKCFMIKNN
ncbi:conserved hypothetical protein [Ricinus communis]|uniref:Uncharacterized protein n=1 Tax=Ricinus communis TaxID=3988 RepID=B9S310_RICCO|nr:conserved hypothetical protein [Ricinus communis]